MATPTSLAAAACPFAATMSAAARALADSRTTPSGTSVAARSARWMAALRAPCSSGVALGSL